MLFFFSSRRRHTRSLCDWSSDVCSSDLKHGTADGKSWENANVMEAISKLEPSLPHLEPLLVAFFKGALETWKRFTSEFQRSEERRVGKECRSRWSTYA